MIWNPAKLVALFICFLFWIFIALIIIGCSSVNTSYQTSNKYPVGMDEDNQGFYNSKYNLLDNGQDDPNINVEISKFKF